MNPPLLIAVSCAYLWAAFNYYMESKYGMSVAFTAYAVANIGFIFV